MLRRVFCLKQLLLSIRRHWPALFGSVVQPGDQHQLLWSLGMWTGTWDTSSVPWGQGPQAQGGVTWRCWIRVCYQARFCLSNYVAQVLDVGGESAGTDGRSGVQYIKKKEVGPISGSGPGTCSWWTASICTHWGRGFLRLYWFLLLLMILDPPLQDEIQTFVPHKYLEMQHKSAQPFEGDSTCRIIYRE